ncbi:MAG TPA: extracellular solute-binding protein [Phycisphaerales bacterium]|nr:extracellular solute-binding protein [Phycisphaerales bacterium]
MAHPFIAARRRIGAAVAVGTLAALAAALLVFARDPGRRGAPARAPIVLYTSADAEAVRPVLELFERRTGRTVRWVGDTEATKTTGLVQRLIAERGRPRADVWWSSEELGTTQLAAAGILAEHRFETAAALTRELGRSGEVLQPSPRYARFAPRARVIVYNTALLAPDRAPRSAAALTDPALRGRVGIARPAFGTTRTHLAALYAAAGPEPFRAWVRALNGAGVRLYDGNMSVVRAVASGEVYAGLTDTDDVAAGKANGWPVEALFEAPGAGGGPVPALGTILIYNTVALVAGGPDRQGAAALAEFLLGPEVERLLVEDSRVLALRPELAAEFPARAVPSHALAPVRPSAADADAALRIFEEELAR